VPLLNNGQVVGVLWLAAHTDLNLEGDTLPALVDGLRIIARERLALAHKERVNLNQTESVRIVLHDIRSPLTSMQGFASMLEAGMAGELNEKQLHFVERILAGITTITGLVENIQDAGRYDPETGFYVMQREPCDLEEIISRIIQQHIVPAEKQELTLSADLETAPIINADRTMLERAITNLIDNAIKYTPNGGQITVGVERQDDDIVITVKDSGYGISPENQRMLFERHARIERPEHKRVKGSGLGLFIVRSVAQRHGGRAWVESQEGQGSAFKFSIPITPFDTID
jgi:signal transduction histidine kinase